MACAIAISCLWSASVDDLSPTNNIRNERHAECVKSGARRRQRNAIISADAVPLEASGSLGGKVPSDRHSDLELPGVDYVAILSGDQLYRIDFREMLDTHCTARADVTIAAVPVTSEQAASFGIMRIDA